MTIKYQRGEVQMGQTLVASLVRASTAELADMKRLFELLYVVIVCVMCVVCCVMCMYIYMRV